MGDKMKPFTLLHPKNAKNPMKNANGPATVYTNGRSRQPNYS